jgi:hypothetical protein
LSLLGSGTQSFALAPDDQRTEVKSHQLFHSFSRSPPA